jgi:hypothetical protein
LSRADDLSSGLLTTDQFPSKKLAPPVAAAAKVTVDIHVDELV